MSRILSRKMSENARKIVISLAKKKFKGRGWQARFAKELGVHPGMVSKWAHGESMIGERNLVRSAEVLNVPISLFYGGKAAVSDGDDAADAAALWGERHEVLAEAQRDAATLLVVLAEVQARGDDAMAADMAGELAGLAQSFRSRLAEPDRGENHQRDGRADSVRRTGSA